MPILVLLLVFVALVYGAVRSFDAIAVRFGADIAFGVAVLVAALVSVLIARWWQRRREVAANLDDGDWTHGVSGDWGAVRLAAGKRLCDVTLGTVRGSYIFADLQSAHAAGGAGEADGWHVELHVADRVRPLWRLPMRSEREAKRWVRIFTLAIAQRL